MRAIIMDTNRGGEIAYNLESIRKQMKNFTKIPILLERTPLEKVTEIDPNEIIGYLEHISLRKGIYRADAVIVQPEYKDLVEAYIKIDQFHLALNIDGEEDPETNQILIHTINDIYYAYMEKNIT